MGTAVPSDDLPSNVVPADDLPGATEPVVKNSSLPQAKTVTGMDAFAGPEVMAHLASGAVAGPLSGLAGIAGSVLPGPEGQGANWVRKVGGALTYEPRTKTAEVMLKPLQFAGEMLHKGAVKAGEYAQDVGAPPSVATGIQTAIETAPSVIPLAKGLMNAPKSAQTLARESQNSVIDQTYNAARKEGYKFPPSETGGGFANARLEGMAGRTSLNQELIMHNQRITNKIAAKEIGLPDNTAITSKILDHKREQLAAPYREVASIDPIVKQDLFDLRTARNAATKWWSYAERTGNPIAEARAKRFSDRANLLEGYIEDAARNSGKPNLVERLKEARTQIAKTYAVERALIEGSGDISAGSLARALDKGVPLTGGLETIAKAHQAFRPYMADAVNLRNPGVGPGHGYWGLAAGASGLHGGLGWFTQGVPLAAGPARSVIMSDAYQNYVGKPTYPGSQMTKGNLAALIASGELTKEERKGK